MLSGKGTFYPLRTGPALKKIKVGRAITQIPNSQATPPLHQAPFWYTMKEALHPMEEEQGFRPGFLRSGAKSACSQK